MAGFGTPSSVSEEERFCQTRQMMSIDNENEEVN